MRRALYLLTMAMAVPCIAFVAACYTFIVAINTGIDCAFEEWK